MMVSIRPMARAASLLVGMYEAELERGGLTYAPPKLGCIMTDSIEPRGPRSMQLKLCGKPSSLKHFSKNMACDVDRKLPIP